MESEIAVLESDIASEQKKIADLENELQLATPEETGVRATGHSESHSKGRDATYGPHSHRTAQ